MAVKKNILPADLLDWYYHLYLPRAIELKMLKLLRQNKISKWFSGIGQEAISVGTTLACTDDDYILPMHRNLGVFTTRNVPLYPLFCQLFGKADGFTHGRERSFHFGIPEHKIIGMISHLAAMFPVACGLGTAANLKNENFVAVAFCGDGATSEGDFHEALNLAAVWGLPVIFIIENNGYGLSTPTSEQYACERLSDRALGYGMKGYHIDGNNILEVYETVTEARAYAISERKPVLIEAKTFRMRGHEEASGTAYVPKSLLEEWASKDPIQRFKEFLTKENLVTESELRHIESKAEIYFSEEINMALKAALPRFNEEIEYSGVFESCDQVLLPKTFVHAPASEDQRFIDAIQNALKNAFNADPSLIIMGQDIAEYGGVFKVTEGFVDVFGKNRIRNTPIIESGALGAAVGLALEGFKPIVEMQFADFITCGFNQIVSNIAKMRYRWSDALPITIRAPHGAGVGAGPFHSVSPEGWFMQHPGLKVVVPATIQDAYELLLASLFDPNPVLFFEHKKLYRGLKESFISPTHIDVLGKAKVVKSGTDISIITYGMGVHWAKSLAEEFESSNNITIEIVDLRTLFPIDETTIVQSVRKTGRVLLLQEANPILGPMSEIATILSEQCFEDLDAPIARCSSLHTPVPVSTILEEGYLPVQRARKMLQKLIDY